MQIPFGWANQETLKWLFYLALAVTAFGLVLGGGLAVFHLFGANPLWVVVFLLGGASGYSICAVCPPPIMGVLLQIVELLEELVSLPLAIVPSPSSATKPIELDEPLIVMHPTPYSPSELFDSYIVSIQATETPYLSGWDDTSRMLKFTASQQDAYLFKSSRQAVQFAQLCYHYNGGRYEVNVYGVTIRPR